MTRSLIGWTGWLALAAAVAAALAMTACEAAPRPPSALPTSPSAGQPSSSAPVTTSTCPSSAELGGLEDRQGAGDGATLWALFFPTGPLLTAGTEIKVVWRMTGSGDFSISATGPDGTVVKPVWGPEPHGDSSWTRPGEEWGTGWVFAEPGCWTVHARRTSGSGYLVLRVAG
jgi:hypothetical protein